MVKKINKKLLLYILVILLVIAPMPFSIPSAYAAHVDALFVGDSIMSGMCQYCSPEDISTMYQMVTNHNGCSSCPCGDTTSQIAYWWNYYIGSSHTYYNAGGSGMTCAQVDTFLTSMLTAHPPQRVYVQCGTNDVPTTTFPQNQTYFDSMVTKTHNVGAIILFGNLPSRASATKTQALNWNSALASWQVGQSNVYVINTYDDMADATTGNLKTNYAGGNGYGCQNIHPSIAGFTVMGQDFANALAWPSPPQPPLNVGGVLSGAELQ